MLLDGRVTVKLILLVEAQGNFKSRHVLGVTENISKHQLVFIEHLTEILTEISRN